MKKPCDNCNWNEHQYINDDEITCHLTCGKFKRWQKAGGKSPIISYKQIDSLLDSYNPALRQHDGMSFAIEIANCQRDLDMRWQKWGLNV